MRLFLAIDLPTEIKRIIFFQTDIIRKKYPQYRWVSEENYHITLYFFGEVKDVNKIKENIKKAIWDINSFFLYSRNLDVFSTNKHIIYLNFYRQKEIERLVLKLKSIFNPINKNERKFIPHLTLARGKRSSKQQYFALEKKLSDIKINISFPVKKIFLFESILSEEKPIYRKIASFSLL
jgi:2'-5' RNA ligase